MTKLVAGILLWSLTHLFPSATPGFRERLLSGLGEKAYKGVFAVLTVLAIYLIVSGWKSTVPEFVYAPPVWGRHVTALLVLFAFILFFAPYPPNNIKRLLRHPQLTGVALWGVGHLFANGEGRSIVLFAGMAAWAIVEMILINRREGSWSPPSPAPVRNDVFLVVGAIVVYVAVASAHQWLFGFSPFA